MFSEVLNAFLW